MKKLPIVSIIGRANVGKSSLFNVFLHRRVAIVHEQEGVTRDNFSMPCQIQDKSFQLMDTAGLMYFLSDKKADTINKQIRKHFQESISLSNIVLFVCDAKQGILPLDKEIAELLRTKAREKTVFLLVNKVDNEIIKENASEFYELGISKIFFISCYHKTGLKEFYDSLVESLPKKKIDLSSEKEGFQVTICGKPNVGKSSLINYLMSEERMVVDDQAGTTRDAVRCLLKRNTNEGVIHLMLYDTAGIKQKSKVKSLVELFSMFRSQEAIKNADLVLIVIDLYTEISLADKKIISIVSEIGKPCIVLGNKWDLFSGVSVKTKIEELKNKLSFLDGVHFLLISAKTGFGVDQIIPNIEIIKRQFLTEIPTSVLNDFIQNFMLRYPAPFKNNRRFKIYYATALTQKIPFEFLLFCNNKALKTDAYLSFLKKSLRRAFCIPNIPVILKLKNKKDSK